MVLVYVVVCLLVLGIGTVIMAQCLTRPTEALMPTAPSGRVKVDQANYRLYRSSSTQVPGTPLAAGNIAVTLPQVGASFRVRVGLENKERYILGKQSSASFYHSCAIALNGRAYCWGSGNNGKLGNGSTANSRVPVAVNTSGVLAGKTIKQISAGENHTCVIASDDRAYCWGGNKNGQLGNGSTANSNVPVAVNMSGVLAGKTIKQMSVEFSTSCVVASDNKVYCWGNNSKGQLGNGSTANSNVPVAVNMSGVLAGKTIKEVTTGGFHTCALDTSNKMYCWGLNSSGRLGGGLTSTLSNVPVAVNMSGVLAGKTIKQMSTGYSSTCAIASDDRAYCWGSGNNGQLGNGSTADSRVPVAVNMSGVLAGKTIKQILAGGDHGCVVASDDKMYCWGLNNNGELGNNSSVNSSVPVAVNTDGVLAGKTIRQMSAGLSSTCAVDSEYNMYCWGYNDNGQLGNNSTNNSRVPARVYASKENTTIAANTMKLRTQYAKKTAATCQAVAAGWRDVTNSSALAYSAAGPNNGTAIAAAVNDPNLPSTSVGYSHQSIVRPGSAAQLTFTNNREINAGETGLWDLALTDNGLERNTNYCVRLAADTTAAPGTSIDTYSYYPEFKTADGSLDIRFADAADATLTNPTTVFSAAMTGRTASATTAKLSNNSSQQIEVANRLSTTGWSVSLAATGGPTAKWTQTGSAANYAFNSTNVDQGQLSVDLSSSAFTASGSTPLGQACTTAGLSYGAGGAFVAGTASANAITLATASSSSGLTCLFKLQNISLKQTIPAYQKPGTYTLPVTVTVVAQ